MAGIMHWLVPKEVKFFELLMEQSENSLEGAKELRNFIYGYAKFDKPERKSKVAAIKSIEHKGDDLSHKIIEKLNRSFITPIDKEDIHHLTMLLDDVTDLINATALRFILLGIENIDDYTRKFADIIVEAVGEMHKNILDLRKLKHAKEHYARAHKLERDADDLYHMALSDLFHFYKNPVDIIKYKEIYELLEKVTDKCEVISRVVESIVVKHA